MIFTGLVSSYTYLSIFQLSDGSCYDEEGTGKYQKIVDSGTAVPSWLTDGTEVFSGLR